MSGTSRFIKGSMQNIDLAIAATEPSEFINDGDDFLTLNNSTNEAAGGYIVNGDGTETLIQTFLDPGIGITAGADSSDDSAFFMARNTAVGAFDITINSGRRVAYEMRLRINQATEVGLFIGLAEAGLDDDIVTDATGALADKDAIGFHVLMDAANVDVDAVTRIEGGTAINAITSMTETETNLFNTYGFRFDGAETLYWYLNNEVVAKQTLAAATFPTGEALTPIFCIKNGEAVIKSFKLDYWRVVQGLLSSDRPE